MNPIDKYELEQFLENKPALGLIAKSCKALYDSLRDEGFTKAEALQMTMCLVKREDNE